MNAHVEPLFSEAVDGELSDADRVRFDQHLVGCPACAQAWRRYQVALGAVRALPPASMPVAVRLPHTAPGRGPSRPSLPHSVAAAWGALRHPRPALAVTLAAAVSVGLVALGAHALDRGRGGATGAGVASAPDALRAAPAISGAAGGGAGAGACAVAPAAGAAATTGAPAGFANSISVSSPGRPGETLVLATQAARYAPGETVLVFARLVSSSSVVLPCVTLDGGQSQKRVQAAPEPALLGPLVIATPRHDLIAQGAPLLAVTVPAQAVPGTVLHLVALVPAGAPAGEAPPMQASLAVTVAPPG